MCFFLKLPFCFLPEKEPAPLQIKCLHFINSFAEDFYASDFKLSGFLYTIMSFEIERMTENKRRAILRETLDYLFLITFFFGTKYGTIYSKTHLFNSISAMFLFNLSLVIKFALADKFRIHLSRLFTSARIISCLSYSGKSLKNSIFQQNDLLQMFSKFSQCLAEGCKRGRDNIPVFGQ